MHEKFVLLVAISGILQGCQKPAEATVDPSYQQSNQATQFEMLKARVDQLDNKRLEQLMRESPRAWLRPKKGFSFLDSPLGTLTVSLDAVTRKDEGSTATLSIGNPTSATITDLSATVSWGPLDKHGLASDALGERKQELAAELPAGRWKTFTIALPDVSADKVGFLGLSDAQVGGVKMGQSE